MNILTDNKGTYREKKDLFVIIRKVGDKERMFPPPTTCHVVKGIENLDAILELLSKG